MVTIRPVEVSLPFCTIDHEWLLWFGTRGIAHGCLVVVPIHVLVGGSGPVVFRPRGDRGYKITLWSRPVRGKVGVELVVEASGGVLGGEFGLGEARQLSAPSKVRGAVLVIGRKSPSVERSIILPMDEGLGMVELLFVVGSKAREGRASFAVDAGEGTARPLVRVEEPSSPRRMALDVRGGAVVW